MSGERRAASGERQANSSGAAISLAARRSPLPLVLAVAVVALLVKGATVAAAMSGTFAFPFQVDDAEGVLLAEAALIAGGVNPYALQPSPAPYFYAGPYPPLYTLVNTAALAAFGPTFKVGRAVQLVATLGVGAWLAWAVASSARGAGGPGTTFRATCSTWLVGAWAALLWLSAHLVAVWAVLVRPDMTALLFNLLGVAVLRQQLGDLTPPPPLRQAERGRTAGDLTPPAPSPSSGEGEQMREDTSVCDTPRPCRASPPLRLTERGLGGEVSPLHLAAAAACFALGWWTKQTFIMVPLAALAVLLWSRSRVAVALGGMYAAFVGIPAAVFTLATGGGFAQKIIGYQGSWEWVAFRRLAEPFASRYGAWLLLAAVAAVAFTLRRRGPTFAAVWFALAGVAALAAGTSGGNHNHFVELLAAAALLVGQGVAGGLHTGTANGRGGRRGVAAIAVVVLLTGVSVAENEGPRGWLAREYTAPTVAQEAGYRAVADYLANTSGPVYSDNVGILVVARQPVRVTDPFTMAAAVRLGRWDDAQLVADVAAGRFAAIALRYDTLDPDRPPTDATPALIRAIEGRYRLAERNILYVYVPK